MRAQGNICATLFGGEIRGTTAHFRSNSGRLSQDHKLARGRRTIFRSEEATNSVAIICSGWAYAYIPLPDGGRQVLSFLLPGDITSAAAVFQNRSRNSIEAITDISYCVINKAQLRALLATDQKAFEEFSKIWVKREEEVGSLATDLGHRSGEQRIARLLVGLLQRLGARDMGRDNQFEFPLRQQHIADATGLTVVHVSRVISTMRRLGIIDIGERVVTVLKLPELQDICD